MSDPTKDQIAAAVSTPIRDLRDALHGPALQPQSGEPRPPSQRGQTPRVRAADRREDLTEQQCDDIAAGDR